MTSGVWLAPGQGGYPIGVVRQAADEEDLSAVLRTAEEVLGGGVPLLDDASIVSDTRASQVALLLRGVSSGRRLLARGIEPTYLAGHSLGEWTAAVLAGSLDLPTAIRLVDLRGREMAAHNPPGYGMAAVIGLPVDVVDRIAAHVRDSGDEVWASNRNAVDQTTVSGSPDGLRRVVDLARSAGATRATVLHVPVAAHSPLMRPVAQTLADELRRVEIRRPERAVVGNVTGRLLRTAAQVRDDLAQATARPVAWATALATLRERGVDYWVQLDPGSELTHMVQRQWPKDPAWACTDVPVGELTARIVRLA